MNDGSPFEYARRETTDFIGNQAVYEKRRISSISELTSLPDKETQVRRYVRSALEALKPGHRSSGEWVNPNSATLVFHAHKDSDLLTALETVGYDEVMRWLGQHKGKIFTRPFTLFQLDPNASAISGNHLNRVMRGENIVAHEKKHASADKHLSDGKDAYVALRFGLVPHGNKNEFEVQGHYTNCVGARYRYKDRIRIRLAPDIPSYADISGAEKAVNHAYPPYAGASVQRDRLRSFINQKKPFDLGTMEAQLLPVWLSRHPEIDHALFQK